MGTALWVIAIIFVIGLGVFIFGPGIQQSQVETGAGGATSGAGCPDSQATIVFASQNELSKSSTVTGLTNSVKTRVVGQAEFSAAAGNATTYPVGAKLQILNSASNFIANVQEGEVICGGGTLTASLFATDAVGIDVINSDGNKLSSQIALGGTVNQSAIALGGAEILEIKLKGTDKQSTGNLIMVIELNKSIQTVTLDGVTGSKDQPQFYTTTLSVPSTWSWEVPAVVGATQSVKALGITMKSGQTYTGNVTINTYSEQAFQDTDGVFKVGIEDADGTAKYEDNSFFVFQIDAA